MARLKTALGGIAAAAVMLAAVGCDEPAEPPGEADAGPLREWMSLDAGPPINTDVDYMTEGCGYTPNYPPPDEDAPYCDASVTEACLVGCEFGTLTGESFACINACLMADPAPPSFYYGNCQSCFFLSLVSCAQQNGCRDQYVAQRCCQVACANGDPSCFDPTCQREEEAVNACLFTATTCLNLLDRTHYATCLGEVADADSPEGGS